MRAESTISRVAAASAWAAASSIRFDEPLVIEQAHLTLARLLLTLGDDVRQSLERLAPAAEAGDQIGAAIEALVSLVIAHGRAGSGP